MATQATSAVTRAVRADPAFIRQRLEEMLDELAAVGERAEVRTALGEQILTNVRQQHATIRARLAAEFTVVVIGEFKRGKSTLINALLGWPAVSAAITPETVVVTELRAGPELKLEACLDNGLVAELQPHELAREELEPLLAELPAPVTRLRFTVAKGLSPGVCLVDTPGTGDILRRLDPLVRDYLWRADLVIYVVMALAPLSASEQTFLRASLLPADFPKVMVAVNMLDLVGDKSEIDRLLDHVRTRIHATLPNAQLFGVSAKDELARQTGAERPNRALADRLADNFGALRDQLRHAIELDRDLFQLDRALDLLRRSLEMWIVGVDRLLSSLAADHVDRMRAVAEAQDSESAASQKVKQAKEHLAAEMQRMTDEAVGWLDVFLNRLDADVQRALEGSRFEDVQMHLHFFLLDLVRSAMSRCILVHQEEIEHLLRMQQQAIAEGFGAAPAPNTDADMLRSVSAATFDLQAYTAAEGFMLAVGAFAGGLFSAAARLLLDGVDQTQTLTEYRQLLRSTQPELRKAVLDSVRAAYTQMALEAEQRLTTAHDRELRQAVSTLQQAEALGATGTENNAAARLIVESLRSTLAEKRTTLLTYRQQLWPTTEADPGVAAAQPVTR